jgi:hypothetical protein
MCCSECHDVDFDSVWWAGTDVSEEHGAAIFRVEGTGTEYTLK